MVPPPAAAEGQAHMRHPALLRALTLALAFVHSFPAQKHLAAFARVGTLGEAWKGFGALCAVGLYLLPLELHVRGLRALWRERRMALRVAGAVLAAVHAVPAFDHLPRFVATGDWADAWRGVGSTIAFAWFLAPLRAQATVIATLARIARLARVHAPGPELWRENG
jgi:hypothetical protein